ncbi:hypothetical protein C7E12_22615, partial [Stenotrophomonas maltophilia]
SGFGIDDKPRATAAAGALLGYVEETQKQRLPHLLNFFKLHDLSGFGIDDKPRATAAAGALLGYVEETQKQRLPHL